MITSSTLKLQVFKNHVGSRLLGEFQIFPRIYKGAAVDGKFTLDSA